MKDLLIDGSVPSKTAQTFDERSLLRGRPRDVAGTASHAPDRTGSYKPATEVGGRHHVDNEGDPMVPRLRAQRAVPSWSRRRPASCSASNHRAVLSGHQRYPRSVPVTLQAADASAARSARHAARAYLRGVKLNLILRPVTRRSTITLAKRSSVSLISPRRKWGQRFHRLSPSAPGATLPMRKHPEIEQS